MFEEVLSSELVDQEQKPANGNQQKTRLEARKPLTTYFITAFIRENTVKGVSFVGSDQRVS